MILLSGASGFVGSHLLRGLQQTYGAANVLAYTSRPIAGTQCILHQGYSPETTNFADAGYPHIHTLIHAGAATPANGKEARDEALAATNLASTRTLLNGQFPNLRQLICISSLDVYAPATLITEDTPTAPSTPYGLSKLHTEELCTEFALQHNLIHQTLRLGHVYGPGEEKYQKMIPATFQRLRTGQSPQLYGEGAERRAFIYIADVVTAILAALKLPESAGPINIAGDTPISMRDLLTLIMQITGSTQPVETIPTSTAGQDIVFNIAKLQRLLLPTQTPLATGLRAEWQALQGA